jgi:hypothetical protein
VSARVDRICRWLAPLAVAVSVATAGACDRTHLIATSGDAGDAIGSSDAKGDVPPLADAAHGDAGAGEPSEAAAPSNGGADGAAGMDATDGGGPSDRPTEPAGDAGDAASGPGDAGDSESGPAVLTVIASGNDALVDLFATPAGLIVVHRGGVRLLDAGGAETAHVDFSGGITAAALDGDQLVVAERGRFTALTTDLKAGPAAPLTATCGGAALFDGTHFVCGPANIYDTTLRTYDTATGKEIANVVLPLYDYEGGRIHRIPGRREFVTLSYGSPTHYELLTIDASGTVSYVNDFPYHGDFPVTHTLAFDSDPATHLIQETGLLLSIHGTPTYPKPCDTTSNGCFVQDGVLGTLAADARFVAMASRADGELYALAASDPMTCAASCTAQVVDLTTRDFRSLGPYTDARLAVPIAAAVSGSPAVLYVGFVATTDPEPLEYDVAAFVTK